MKKLLSIAIVIAFFTSSFSFTCLAKRDISYAETLAGELKELGIFEGVSDADFDLDRAPSKVEALVMLIRILGEEERALNGNINHPFTDVPAWADKYVGYAYSKGYTKGQSETEFGAGEADANTYMTFVLRALGYSDAEGGDFKWDSPYMLAAGIGIINDSVDVTNFLRADVVLISHAALSAHIKGTRDTLAQKLVKDGVFSSEQYLRIYNSHNNTSDKSSAEGRELSAEEIYAKCAPAVFYIELYDERDRAIASGSGFFINDSGMAVTNYHVIEDAYSALIQMSDTNAIHRLSGVYDYSKEDDWAIVQIDCTGNSYLETGDASTANGGAKVYAIGSPLGLQNTISEGIVSNPARIEGNVTYIQTTAAISSGSSGGALLNKMGEVIGITSAGYTKGQNLNLALPISYIENADTTEATFLFEFYKNGENPKTPEENGYGYLYSWIKVNGEADGNNRSVVYKNSEGIYKLTYDSKYDNVIVTFSQSVNGVAVVGLIQLDSLGYGFAVGEEQMYGTIPGKTFTRQSELTCSEYEGDSSLKASMLQVGKTHICKMLDWLGNILESKVGMKLADIGFEAY